MNDFLPGPIYRRRAGPSDTGPGVGVTHPGTPADEDLYVMDEKKQAKLTALPRNLLEATEQLGKSKLAKEVLGEQMLNSFIAYKIDEWERYHQTTTDWEIQEYLRLY